MDSKPPELSGRVWSVTISDGATSYTWNTLPVKFKGTQTMDLHPNEMDLTIFNLGPKSRKFIDSDGLKLIVKAGYSQLSGEIFKGNIEKIKTVRESGQYQTTIKAKDGAANKRNLFMSFAIKENTPIKQVIEKILEKIIKEGLGRIQVKGLENATQGTKKTAAQRLADFDKKTSERKAKENKPKERLTRQEKLDRKKQRQREAEEKRAQQRQKLQQKVNAEAESTNDPGYITVNAGKGKVLRGNCMDLLQEVCESNNLQPVQLNGAIHIIPKDTAMGTVTPILDKTSGLIGIPEKTATGWIFNSLMRVDISIGTVIKAKWKDGEGSFLVRRIEFDAHSDAQPWYMKIEAVPSSVL